MQAAIAFGPMLRSWRKGAQLSQQTLAEQAEVSTRHVSFLENGRATPSREMVLALANALELPLRERNALLTAAGFAAVYRESPLDGEHMIHLRRALGRILAQQEPYGAVVLDRYWNIIDMNAGAKRMLGFFVDDLREPRVVQNLMHASFHPAGIRKYVVQWEDAAADLMERLHRESRAPGGEQTLELIEALLAYPDVPVRFSQPDVTRRTDPFLPLHLRRNGVDARLFTIIGTLGTPLDVTAQELRIESYFPADDATDAWLKSLVNPAKSS